MQASMINLCILFVQCITLLVDSSSQMTASDRTADCTGIVMQKRRLAIRDDSDHPCIPVECVRRYLADRLRVSSDQMPTTVTASNLDKLLMSCWYDER